MALFRFRAAAALELRLKQEHAAAAAAARTEADLGAARAILDETTTRRLTAQQGLTALQAHGTDIDTLLWHRNWISALAKAVDQRSLDVERLDGFHREAERAWREARRKRLALERLRDHARQRHQQQELGAERKAIDELARLRFAMREEG